MEPDISKNTSNLFEMTKQGLRLGDQIVCGHFEVMGRARTPLLSENWSTVLKFADHDNKIHELFVSANELLDAKALIERLSANGLMICSPSKREKIVEFIANSDTRKRFSILEGSGWVENKFYLPYSNEFIGDDNEKTINKLKPHAIAKNSKLGSIDDWNENLGFLMTDNSNLILAVSTALAAPLLKLLNKQNYGFNFLGKSSIGKSTILEFAASAIGSSCKGNENYLCNFRATDNALESIGFGHNDMCLMLDEFGQLDPFKAKDTVYLLGNGFTKARSSKSGEANERKSFNITFLSSSEISLNSTLMQTGQKMKSGLEVRFIDIEADVNSNHGCYENLHGFKSGKELSDYIKTETKKNYGTLFEAFIRLLVKKRIEDDEGFKKQLQEWHSEFIQATASNDNQITNRIISSIALNYVAMRLASENGLIKIEKSNLIVNLQKISHSISEKFGQSHNEENTIIEEVRDFILANEKSRFDHDLGGDPKVFKRVGFKKQINGDDYYCIFGATLKNEICSGWSHKQITSALEKNGFLQKNAQDKFSHSINFYNANLRVYPIHSKILEYEVSA